MKMMGLSLCFAFALGLAAQEPAPLKLVKTIPLPGVQGRFDHFALDAKGHRLFVSCGQGFVEVIDQRAPDAYQVRDRLPTRAGARTSFFSADVGEFYLAVPQKGSEPAEIRVFRPQP